MSPWIGPGRTIATSTDEIVEFFRTQARQHIHLRAAFHLKHANGIGFAKHVINCRIFARHGCEIVSLSAVLSR